MLLTEVPVNEAEKNNEGWICPVCGKVNAPSNEMCVDGCISKEVAENAKKNGTKQLLVE
jgi:hypothetical protein